MARNIDSAAIMPHTTPALFKAVFALAASTWPGKTLTLLGVRGDDVVMQQWGNTQPFVLSLEAVKHYARAEELRS